MTDEKPRSEIAKRLKQIRESMDIRQEDVAEPLGLTPQAISKWENSDWHPSLDLLVKIADAMGISFERLSGLYPSHAFPVVGRVAAGQPKEAIQIETDNLEQAPPDVAKDVHQGSFFLRVCGDSMDRYFPDGMLVLVDPKVEWHDRDIVVAQVGDCDATVKRIFDAGDTVVLHPESTNPEHSDIVTDSESFKVVGKVIWAMYPRGTKFNV